MNPTNPRTTSPRAAAAAAAAAACLLALLGVAAAFDTYPNGVIIDQPSGDGQHDMLKFNMTEAAGGTTFSLVAVAGSRGCTTGEMCVPGGDRLKMGTNKAGSKIKLATTANGSYISMAQHAHTDAAAANVSLTAAYDNVTGTTTAVIGQPGVGSGVIRVVSNDGPLSERRSSSSAGLTFETEFIANSTLKGEISYTYEDQAVEIRSKRGVVRLSNQARVRSDNVRVFSAVYKSDGLALPQASVRGHAEFLALSQFDSVEVTENRAGYIEFDDIGNMRPRLRYIPVWSTVRIVAEVSSASSTPVTIGICGWQDKFEDQACPLYPSWTGDHMFEIKGDRFGQSYAYLSADNNYTGTIQWEGRMKIYARTKLYDYDGVRWGVSSDWHGATPGLVSMNAVVTIY